MILPLTICDPNFVNVLAGKVAKSDSNGRNGEEDKRVPDLTIAGSSTVQFPIEIDRNLIEMF